MRGNIEDPGGPGYRDQGFRPALDLRAWVNLADLSSFNLSVPLMWEGDSSAPVGFVSQNSGTYKILKCSRVLSNPFLLRL